MNAKAEQLLIEKLKALPPEQRAEVEDFIDFLHNRASDRRFANITAELSEPALRSTWDNDQDAAYDRL